MSGNVGGVVRQLQQLLDGDGARDADLLERFAHGGEEAAFADLVRRHGPMVFGLCRRVLGSVPDADDAFQATFLVLARRASAIRKPDSLAAWLHGVAFRLAMKMRSRERQRRQHERQLMPPEREAPPAPPWRELQPALDEELLRLPEKQRQPLLLCYLRGLTQAEAARQLGLPRGTLKRRLERGREVLRDRLTRRGLSLAALLAVLPAGAALAVPAPALLGAELARSAAPFAARQALPAGSIANHVVSLAEGVLKTMRVGKSKSLVAALLVLGLSVGGALLYAQAVRPGEDRPPAATPQGKPVPKEPSDLDKLQGTWRIVRGESGGMFLPKKALAQMRLRFRGKRMFWLSSEGEEVLPNTVKLDPAKKPKEIDVDGLGDRAISMIGIYKLEGGKLFLAITRPDIPRPDSFVTFDGSQSIVYELEREKDGAKDKPQKVEGK